jgi:menaquinone-dependent protoporphyrinogen oxidase
MKRVLFAYTSKRGQVLKILKFLESKLENTTVDYCKLTQCHPASLDEYDYILVASSISYGAFDNAMYHFVNKNRAVLDKKPNAFLSVNLTARKPEKAIPENSVYIQKFLKRSFWQPKHIEMAAGLLDYPSYNMLDRFAIKLIMTITDGETDTTKSIEYTDWHKLERFAKKIYNTY